jgi:hypothetical protein
MSTWMGRLAMKTQSKRQENLLAKIAALTNKPVEEIKQAQALYTEEEAALEAMSVLNYYNWRKDLVRQKDEPERIWEARQKQWRYKICEGCKAEFAYSYHYDGVKFCSLDCLQIALRKIGLEVTYGRSLMKRWGLTYPGIVPSSALQSVKLLLPSSDEAEAGHDVPSQSSHPKSPTDTDSSHQLQEVP